MDFSKIRRIGIIVWKSLCAIFAALCMVCGLVPLIFYSHFNVGNIALLAYGLALTVVLIVKGKRHGASFWHKFLYWTRFGVSVVLALCFIAGAVISGFMIKYAFFNQPPAYDAVGSGGTVVVLGCQVYGDRPSVSLQGRLDAAYTYLESHENSKVIVSGGQGEDEEVSEAYAMQKYLVGRGISEDRILLEDLSESTDENIKFSGEIIEKHNLPDTMYIVTDLYHSCRAFLFAQKHGYRAYNISAKPYWPLLGEYWVRDILGVLHMTLTPNWEIKI